MTQPTAPSRFWQRWLQLTTIGVMAFGIAMVLLPDWVRQGFSWLVYARPLHIDTFGVEATAYVSLVHAVLGAVIFGWGTVLLMIVHGPLRRGRREGWQMLAVSVAVWFIPDTAYSLWSGFWQNALLNLGFAVLFAIPLAATYRACHRLDA